MHNLKKVKMQNCVKILRLLPPMSFSALKPGPVVPPGIEKVPNQAARISQSVKKCHLSDILGFLRGGRFFDVFFTFSWFQIYHFSDFCIFEFCHFLCFLIFLILSLFNFWWFLSKFYCCDEFLIIFVSKLGASTMTHFSPSKPALPLSPILVVKSWPIFVL